MAAVTLLGAATFNTTSGTKTVIATPAVNDLIVLVVAHTGNTATTAPTDNNSDGLGTYTLLETAVKSSSADTMKFWVRNKLVGSGTSTTFTTAPGATSGGGLGVLKVTGMTRTGAYACKQTAKQDNQGAATPAPAFTTAALTGNPVIGAVMSATNPAALSPRTGFTELVDTGYATPATGIEIMSRDSGETGTTQTWGSAAATGFCSIVVELNITAVPLATFGFVF